MGQSTRATSTGTSLAVFWQAASLGGFCPCCRASCLCGRGLCKAAPSIRVHRPPKGHQLGVGARVAVTDWDGCAVWGRPTGGSLVTSLGGHCLGTQPGGRCAVYAALGTLPRGCCRGDTAWGHWLLGDTAWGHFPGDAALGTLPWRHCPWDTAWGTLPGDTA